MKKITIRNSGQLGLWGDFQNTDLNIINDGGRIHIFDYETTQYFLRQTQNNYRLAHNDVKHLPPQPNQQSNNRIFFGLVRLLAILGECFHDSE